MLLRYFRQKSEPAHLSVLRDIPLFSGLRTYELETLNDHLHQRTYVANEVIFDQNEEGQAVYFILSGKVEIRRQPQMKTLAILGPGLFFGERALLTDEPRSAQAKAVETCKVAVLFRDDFLNLLKTHPQIAASITEHAHFRNLQQPISLEEDEERAVFINTTDTPGPLTWVAIFAVTCLLLLTFKKILWLLAPFLFALILYYLLSPLAKKMLLKGFSSQFTAVSLSGAFLMLIGLAVLLFYPLTMAKASQWQEEAMHYLSGGSMLLDKVLHSLEHRFMFLNSTEFGKDYYLKFHDFAEHFSDRYLGSIIMNVATWLPSLLLTPVITFFMLKDGAAMRKMLGNAVPNAFFEKTLYLMHAIDRTAKLYFMGLIKITVFDALIMGIAFCFIGLHNPLFLGLLVAILCWIPYLGPLVGYALITMVAATDFPGNSVLLYQILGIFIGMRVLDDFIFMPLVIGKSLEIHPLITVLMFTVGETIAGVPGLMLVIPLLGIVMVLGETLELILTDKRLLARYRHSQKLAWRAAAADLSS